MLKELLAAYERDLILGALQWAKWSRTKAAKVLDIPKSTLIAKMHVLAIEEYERSNIVQRLTLDMLEARNKERMIDSLLKELGE